MFSPSKTWRRWMHVIKKNERRFATASAIAASGITSLVMSRGHKIEKLNEIPFVVSDEIETYTKTKVAYQFLKRANCNDDLQRVKDSKHIRAGKGKRRNRRYVQKLGPLIVYKTDKGISRAFRNIPGVDLAAVDRLNLLQLAPGGHVGRLVIWTESAFAELNGRFGTYGQKGDSKFHLRNGAPYQLPRSIMQNTDVTRIIESDEIQSVVRDRKIAPRAPTLKKNPLKNLYAMQKLNPLAIGLKRAQIKKRLAKVNFDKKKKDLGSKWVVKPREKKAQKDEKVRQANSELANKFLTNLIKDQ
jgi:large subunit ribosomal protein L4e